MNYRTEAIVLKSWDCKEYDRVYEIFSLDYGRMVVVAKGVRRTKARLASGLEPLSRSLIYLFKGKKMDRIVGVLLIDNFLKLKKNLNALVEVNRAVNILRNFIGENEPNRRIYQYLNWYLSEVHQKNNLLKLFLLWLLIEEGGYRVQWYRCIKCQKKLKSGGRYCFFPLKGIGCEKCFSIVERIKISEENIKILRIFNKGKEGLIKKIKIESRQINQLERLTKIVLEKILSKQVYL